MGNSVIGLDEVMIQTLPVTDLRFHSRRSCVSNSCPAAGTDRERGEKVPSEGLKEDQPPGSLLGSLENSFLTGQGKRQQVHRLWCGVFLRALVVSSQKHALCLERVWAARVLEQLIWKQGVFGS